MELIELIFVNSWQLLLTSATFAIVVTWYIRNYWQHVATNLPPGPRRIPFPFNGLISLLSSQTSSFSAFDQISKRYGDLAYIHIGNRRLVLISSHDIVKELIVKQADIASGRFPEPNLNEIFKYDNGGIIFSNDDVWLENRRFALKALRTMGMGKRGVEHAINEEAKMLCAELQHKHKEPSNLRPILYNAVSNIISSISFGHRFEYSDPIFKGIISDIYKLTTGETGFLFDMPSIFLRTFRRRVSRIKELIDKEVESHQKCFEANDQRDLIDMFIAETKRLQAEGTKTQLKPDCFWTSVIDLFLAGTETTTTTLSWAILFMAGKQEMQKKIASEVDQIVGQGRKPTYEDRKKMPFTQAFLFEVLRLRPVAPVGVPHVVNSDVMVQGYCIPKGTELAMNIHRMHTDPRVWKDPNVFRPKRFLSDDGKSVVKPPEFIPFGAGRRVCLGEQLAKMESFLFLVNLVQRFSFKLPEGTEPNYNHQDLVQVMSPIPYKVIVTER